MSTTHFRNAKAGNYTTDKAKSIDNLRVNASEMFCLGQPPNYSVTPHDAMPTSWPKFGRPCPKHPRHGFVDSRLVNNEVMAWDLFRRTIAEDHRGEVMFMDTLTGKYSGVADSLGVTWAKGNDGVTSGDPYGGGRMRHIPAQSASPLISWTQPFGMTVRAPTVSSHTCMEIVEDRGAVLPVQLRTCPRPAGRTSHIPHTRTIKKWLVPLGQTLLKWEEECKGMDPETVGIWLHPDHYALSSHYAVHGIAQGLTVVSAYFCPEDGVVIKPDLESPTPAKLTPGDYKIMAAWAANRLLTHTPIDEGVECKAEVLTLVGTLHTMPFFGRDAHHLRLRAEGAAACLLYVLTACVGESRWFYRQGPGRHVFRDRRGFRVEYGHNLPNADQALHTSADIIIPSVEDAELEWDYAVDLAAAQAAARSEPWYDPKDNDWADAAINPARYRPSLIPWKKIFGEHGKEVVDGVKQRANAQSPPRHSIFEMYSVLPLGTQIMLGAAAREDLCDPNWPNGYGGDKWEDAAKRGLVLADKLFAFISKPNAGHWTAVVTEYNRTINVVHNNGKILSKWVEGVILGAAENSPVTMFLNPHAATLALTTKAPKFPLPYLQARIAKELSHEC